jgi:hypothetical protein
MYPAGFTAPGDPGIHAFRQISHASSGHAKAGNGVVRHGGEGHPHALPRQREIRNILRGIERPMRRIIN